MIDQLTTTVDNKLNISDLKPQHYAFGGRGDVWSDTAHIAQSGEYVTMCGRPMLSSNWVKMEGVDHIGCPKCLAKYNSQMGWGIAPFIYSRHNNKHMKQTNPNEYPITTLVGIIILLLIEFYKSL